MIIYPITVKIKEIQQLSFRLLTTLIISNKMEFRLIEKKGLRLAKIQICQPIFAL